MSENEKNAYEFIVKQLQEIRCELKQLNQKLSGKEKIFCAICGEEIEEDDDVMNDNSNSYGGDCHESCFLEAEESRL